MPTPAQAAKLLKKTARNLERVADESVRAAAEFAVESAVSSGGAMGRYRLLAEVRSVSNKGGRSTALVLGVPPGYWAIKSYGRRGGYTVRAGDAGELNLRRSPQRVNGRTRPATAFRSVKPGPTSGDNRWTVKVVDATAAEYPLIGQTVLEQSLELG